MSPPTVRVNTLTRDNTVQLDSISKIFIIIEAVFGISRFNILNGYTTVHKRIVAFYVVALNTVILLANGYFRFGMEYNVVDLCSYIFCTIFTSITYKRLQRFFKEINSYDNEVGCQSKTGSFVKKNVMIHIIIVFFLIGTIFVYLNIYYKTMIKWEAIPIHFMHVLELYFYSHLFSLIYPRIKLINYYVESSLTQYDKTLCKKPNSLKYYTRAGMQRDFSDVAFLMDLYQIIITAHIRLIDAIKWQFLIILTTSFLTTLNISYAVILELLISNERTMSAGSFMSFISFSTVNIVCLFMPCVYGAKLRNEVRKLRMLLASRLYENKMDKCSRIAARALLTLTAEYDCSLSLLGMVDVDLCLPIKYLCLLVTYLIIMLQFQKVVKN